MDAKEKNDREPDRQGMAALPAIGKQLATARRAKNMSHSGVASHLRLSVNQVKALEKGDPTPFPSPVYVIGHVRGYAILTGLDAAPLCARLREPKKIAVSDRELRKKLKAEAKAQAKAKAEAIAESRVEAGTVSDFIPAGLVHKHSSAGRMAIAALGIFALAYGGWYAWDTQLLGGNTGDDGIIGITASVSDGTGDADINVIAAPEVVPVIVEDADIVAPVIDEINESEAVAALPSDSDTATPPLEPRAGQAVAHNRDPVSEITLRASAVSWVEITRADGSAVSSGLMRAGDEYIVPGDEDVYLTTGNAGGLEIEIRGADAISLGASGETISELPLDPALLSERY